MERIKRIPIFYPLFVIIGGLSLLFYVFPLWLVGYWWCADCGKRSSSKDEMISMVHADVCKECAMKFI